MTWAMVLGDKSRWVGYLLEDAEEGCMTSLEAEGIERGNRARDLDKGPVG